MTASGPPPDRPIPMTFSLVAYDEATRSFGSIICSSAPAVAARCAHPSDGAGAAHTQNVTDPRLGPRILELMAAGKRRSTS